MVDGHTVEGAYPVTIDFTADQVAMAIRSIRWALMASGSGLDSSGNPQKPMQQIAYQKFLEEMLAIMEKALKEQKP